MRVLDPVEWSRDGLRGVLERSSRDDEGMVRKKADIGFGAISSNESTGEGDGDGDETRESVNTDKTREYN